MKIHLTPKNNGFNSGWNCSRRFNLMSYPLQRIFTLMFMGCLLDHSILAEVKDLGSIRFDGEIYENTDISAVAYFGGHLMIGSDEGTKIQILEKGEDEFVYKVRSEPIKLLA
jgi:hypothetical protein